MRRQALLGALLSGVLLAGSVQAAPVTKTIAAHSDTLVARNNPNQNFGKETELELRATAQERVLVSMDSRAVREAIGNGRLVSARLVLDVIANQSTSGGTPIAVHPLARAWNEGDGKTSGATWNCANDSNLANNKIDCADSNVWDMSTGLATWGATAATTVVSASHSGPLGLDVTAALAAELAGQDSFGWVVMKPDSSSKGRVSFASRERGAQGPRLELTVEPPNANTWMNWSGAASQTAQFHTGYPDHGTLKLGTDRVLWIGYSTDTEWPLKQGHLRLFAVDRNDHTITVLVESSLTALLPDFMAERHYDWGDGSNLFRLADGGVVVVFNSYAPYSRELVFVTLDVKDDGFVVRGEPVVVDGGALIEPDDMDISFHRSAVAQIADSRFLFSYRRQPHYADHARELSTQSTEQPGLNLFGNAALFEGALVLTEAGDDSGVGVWEIDLVQGMAIDLWVYGTSEDGSYSIAIDRESGPGVVNPIAVMPRRQSYYGVGYLFLAPYTGKAYVKFRAPANPGGSVLIHHAGLQGQNTERLQLRTVDLAGGNAVVGSAIPIPGDGSNGEYLRIRSVHMDKLDGGRLALYVNTADPVVGYSQAITRILRFQGTDLAMGEWATVVPSTMGPDYPFSTDVNTDTMAEGMIASVAWDAMNDEPLVGPFAVVGDRVIPTGARILESAEGSYRNQVRYLGNNEYILAQEVEIGYDELTGRSVDMQHFYVFSTDGQGKIVQQAGPFEHPEGVSRPRIERLDDDHLLVLWHQWYYEDSEESGWNSYWRLNGKILYKD